MSALGSLGYTGESVVRESLLGHIDHYQRRNLGGVLIQADRITGALGTLIPELAENKAFNNSRDLIGTGRDLVLITGVYSTGYKFTAGVTSILTGDISRGSLNNVALGALEGTFCAYEGARALEKHNICEFDPEIMKEASWFSNTAYLGATALHVVNDVVDIATTPALQNADAQSTASSSRFIQLLSDIANFAIQFLATHGKELFNLILTPAWKAGLTLFTVSTEIISGLLEQESRRQVHNTVNTLI